MIDLLVVLYNKHIKDSETLMSILDWSYSQKSLITKITVWNNSYFNLTSEEKLNYKNQLGLSNIFFYEDGKNHALSFVYNQIIKFLESCVWLIILDHDSNIPGSYVEEIQKISNNIDCPNLILPQIYYDAKLVSPAKQLGFFGYNINQITPGLHLAKNMTAINSGMCIKTQYLKNTFKGYNEKIKFYGTDNDFMWKYSRDNKYLYVTETKINHILNYYEEEDPKKKKARFNDIKNGIIECARQQNKILVPLAELYLKLYKFKNL